MASCRQHKYEVQSEIQNTDLLCNPASHNKQQDILINFHNKSHGGDPHGPREFLHKKFTGELFHRSVRQLERWLKTITPPTQNSQYAHAALRVSHLLADDFGLWWNLLFKHYHSSGQLVVVFAIDSVDFELALRHCDGVSEQFHLRGRHSL